MPCSTVVFPFLRTGSGGSSVQDGNIYRLITSTLLCSDEYMMEVAGSIARNGEWSWGRRQEVTYSSVSAVTTIIIVLENVDSSRDVKRSS
mmetsp:Transcript_2241/g.4099  ORF Transcript_2241/g.4099 Transcript_2241/m.4099 type:complete len:90 (+) Transcript_2241:345-614(+)